MMQFFYGCKLHGRDWKTIQCYAGLALKDRTNEQIKDRFRTLVKQGKANPSSRPLWMTTQRRRGGRKPAVENEDEQDYSDKELVDVPPREQDVAAAAKRVVLEIDDDDTDDEAESEQDMLKSATETETFPRHDQVNTCGNKNKYT
jgi:Myb-like DNA-binding domain